MVTNYPIHICSLDAVRETDVSIYDGIITIEDTNIEEPFRVDGDYPKQLVLRFDDISVPIDDFVEPQKKHIIQALSFADTIGDGSLLVHCHAGISRSSAIALAIIAKRLGAGKEEDSVKILENINSYAHPNKTIVWMTDEILEREMELYNTTSRMLSLTN